MMLHVYLVLFHFLLLSLSTAHNVGASASIIIGAALSSGVGERISAHICVISIVIIIIIII